MTHPSPSTRGDDDNHSSDLVAYLERQSALSIPPVFAEEDIEFVDCPNLDLISPPPPLGPQFLPPALILDEESYLDYPTLADGELLVEDNENNLFYEDFSQPPPKVQVSSRTVTVLTTPCQRFKSHMVHGEAVRAASVIVAQSLFQTSQLSDSPLPVANVMLFLYLAKLVFSTGKLQQGNLSKVLQILYPYADKWESAWAPMPSTVSGFTSRITNVTNSNAMVSILPIPSPETLPDGHGYTPFREILNHALMIKMFEAHETKDPKWQSLASSKKFKNFLQHIITQRTGARQTFQQIAVGIIVWTDGWDTSTGTK
jgi:hypothetical protein